MATLLEKADIAEDPTFIRRVRQAMTAAAGMVASESDQTPNHADRAELANAILALPNEWAKVFAIGVANNPNTGTGNSDPAENSPAGDSALEYVMGTLWDGYAG